MTTNIDDRARTVVPRWRPSLVSAFTGELSSAGSLHPALFPTRAYLDTKLAEWLHNPSIETAADLVSSALVVGATDEAAPAARAILTDPSTATSAVKLIAKRLLYAWSPEEISTLVTLPSLGPPATLEAAARSRIRILKRALSDSPRNALKWADLALEYARLAQGDKAFWAMERALSIAPQDRFLLRSYCRLAVHFNQPDKAHDLLLRSRRTNEDPWLMAPEIAVASIRGHTSRNIKKAIALLNSNSFSPRHTSELASALATVDLMSGDFRMSRRYFRDSLKNPTDNALAQASWASKRLGGLDLDPSLFDQPLSFEARTRRFRDLSEWADTVNSSVDWMKDEPFSSRPALTGSYVTSIALQDFQLAEKFARVGLLANPDDVVLRNNLAYILASLDRVDEGWLEFEKINQLGLAPTETCVLTATRGLLHFRSGDPEIGRGLYEAAVNSATGEDGDRLRALALLHLAREENRLDPIRARIAFDGAQRYIATSDANEIKALASIIENTLAPGLRS